MTKKMHKIKRRWKAADFRRLLAAMRRYGQPASTFCSLAEYPSYNTVYLYMQRNPDFKRAYDEILASLRAAAQAAAHDRFKQEIEQRRQAGQTCRQIAAQLGVSAMTISKRIRRYAIPLPEKARK